MSRELQRRATHQNEESGEVPATASSDDALHRLEEMVDRAFAADGNARTDMAGMVTEALVALQKTADRDRASAVLLSLLDRGRLNDLWDEWGRNARQEAVHTMISFGYPWALQVSAADVPADTEADRLPARKSVQDEEELQKVASRLCWLLVASSVIPVAAAFVRWASYELALYYLLIPMVVGQMRITGRWRRGWRTEVHSRVERFGPAARWDLAWLGVVLGLLGIPVAAIGTPWALVPAAAWGLVAWRLRGSLRGRPPHRSSQGGWGRRAGGNGRAGG